MKKWSINNKVWHNSEEKIKLPPKTYNLTFSEDEGYIKPNDTEITI